MLRRWRRQAGNIGDAVPYQREAAEIVADRREVERDLQHVRLVSDALARHQPVPPPVLVTAELDAR